MPSSKLPSVQIRSRKCPDVKGIETQPQSPSWSRKKSSRKCPDVKGIETSKFVRRSWSPGSSSRKCPDVKGIETNKTQDRRFTRQPVNRIIKTHVGTITLM